ncbi:MAG: DUF3387 domain-containing protein [Anaerolineales bacterium]|nr:DUF3387 domain-containing protein [Anaerolineales bacterium]
MKENVEAKLKVLAKHILLQYSYPLDTQTLVTGTVLKQVELIAEELVG